MWSPNSRAPTLVPGWLLPLSSGNLDLKIDSHYPDLAFVEFLLQQRGKGMMP